MTELLRALLDTPEDDFWQSLFVLFGLSAVSALLLLNVWLFPKWTGRRLFPPQRYRAVPWNGWTILALVFVSMLVQSWTAGALGAFTNSEFFKQRYGPEFHQQLLGKTSSEAKTLAQARLSLWAATLAFGPQLAAALAVLFFFGNARPYQFGWTGQRLGRNLLLGVLAWLVCMPWILTLNLLVTEWYRTWLGGKPEPHELERLAAAHPSSLEWLLLVLSATVLAPVWEELLFRGVLLSWARVRSRNADVLAVWSLGLMLLLRSGHIAAAINSGDRGDLELEAQPVAFTLLMMALYEAVKFLRPSTALAATYATALLFANAHALVWPSPVPLFFLGLALGGLAVRTQSLVGPMVLHCLFNAVACVTLILGK